VEEHLDAAHSNSDVFAANQTPKLLTKPHIYRWDLVEEHLDAAHNNSDFGVDGKNKFPFESRLAYVLLAMHQGDRIPN
jgi:hypothetical protein